MKARSMTAADVVESDAFLALSIEAQLLYLHLLHNGDAVGRIYGAKRVCRGYGFADDALDELYASGYLLDVDGLTLDAWNWVNNKYDGRLRTRLDSLEPYTSGRISFAGEPFKSRYVLNDAQATEERRSNDATASHNTTAMESNTNPNGNTNHKPTESKSKDKDNGNAAHLRKSEQVAAGGEDGTEQRAPITDSSEEAQASKSEGKEGIEPVYTGRCTCTRCGNVVPFENYGDNTSVITCPDCGTYPYTREMQAAQTLSLEDAIGPIPF